MDSTYKPKGRSKPLSSSTRFPVIHVTLEAIEEVPDTNTGMPPADNRVSVVDEKGMRAEEDCTR